MRALPALLATSVLLALPARAEGPKTPRIDRFGEPLPPDAVQRLWGDGVPAQGRAAHFSPDGKTLGFHDFEGRLRLWDVSGVPHEVSRLAVVGSVTNFAFAPDGRTAIASCGDATLRRFDLATGRVLASRADCLPEVIAIASETVLARGPRNGLQVLALATLEPGPTFFEGGSPTRHCSAISPDGKLVAATRGPELLVFDARTGHVVGRKDLPGHWGVHVGFSGTSRLLGLSIVDSEQNGQVLVMDATTLALVASIDAAKRGAPPLAMFPKDDRVALSIDGLIRVHSLPRGELVKTLQPPVPRSFEALEVSPEGKLLAATHGLEIYDLETGASLLPRGASDTPIPLAFSPDGKSVFTYGERERVLERWDVATGCPTKIIADSTLGKVVSVAPTGNLVAIDVDSRSVRVIDASTGRTVVTLGDASINGGVESIAFSPDASLLAVGYLDERTRLYDVKTGTLLGALGGSGALRFLAKGKSLLVYDDYETIRLYNVAKRSLVAKIEKPLPPAPGLSFTSTPAVRGVTASPDGKLIAFRVESRVELVSAERGTPLGKLETGSESGQSGAVAFSTDSRLLACAGAGYGSVAVWDVRSRKKVFEGPHGAAGECRELEGLALSPDGKLVAAFGIDGLVVWRIVR